MDQYEDQRRQAAQYLKEIEEEEAEAKKEDPRNQMKETLFQIKQLQQMSDL